MRLLAGVLVLAGCSQAALYPEAALDRRNPPLPSRQGVPSPPLGRPVRPMRTMQFDFLTYNTWGKPGLLGTKERQRFERLPAALAPYDVVTLQEAFTKHTRGLLPGFPFSHWETSQGFRLMNGGLAVLSRFEILETDFLAFESCTHFDCFALKGVLFNRLNVPGIGPVDLYNTHYQAEEDDKAARIRLDNNRTLADMVQRHDSGHPTLIAGDFNMTPDSPEYKDLMLRLPMRDLFRDLNPQAPGFSYDPKVNPNVPDSEMPQRLDYVFALGDRIRALAAELALSGPVDGYTLSDHLGVHIRVEIAAD